MVGSPVKRLVISMVNWFHAINATLGCLLGMFIWAVLLWIPSGPTGEPSVASHVSYEGSDELKASDPSNPQRSLTSGTRG